MLEERIILFDGQPGPRRNHGQLFFSNLTRFEGLDYRGLGADNGR
jgi:hypothetical protein